MLKVVRSKHETVGSAAKDAREFVDASLDILKSKHLSIPKELDNAELMLDKCRLPPDITKVPSAELSRIMGRCASVISYILPEIAKLGIMLRAYEMSERVAKANALNRAKQKMPRWAAEDFKYTDNSVQNVVRKYNAILGAKELMEALEQSAQNKIAVMSRELTRRGKEVEVSGRM